MFFKVLSHGLDLCHPDPSSSLSSHNGLTFLGTSLACYCLEALQLIFLCLECFPQRASGPGPSRPRSCSSMISETFLLTILFKTVTLPQTLPPILIYFSPQYLPPSNTLCILHFHFVVSLPITI